MDSNCFPCPFPGCVQSYRVEKTLRRHIEAIHGESKRYQCEYCQKKMSSAQNLREHVYIHTGERPYVCTESGCFARFRQGSQLSAHKKVHRAIFNLSNRASFVELKITDLLRLFPQALIEKFEPTDELNGCGHVELPPITNQETFQPIQGDFYSTT